MEFVSSTFHYYLLAKLITEVQNTVPTYITTENVLPKTL